MPATSIFQPNELLNIWEQGFGKSSPQKADELISLYMGTVQEEKEIKNFSVEKKEQYLLEIRRLLFGRKFPSVAHCPSCNEMIEWEMNYSDFANTFINGEFNENYVYKDFGYEIHYRLPNEMDIALDEKIQILKNCVLLVKKIKKKINVDNVPPKIWDKLEEEIETNSPLTSATINLSCPECEHQWNLYFNIFDILWTEFDQWARRFLNAISSLALSYGWSENEIINMNPIRRAYYLKLLSD